MHNEDPIWVFNCENSFILGYDGDGIFDSCITKDGFKTSLEACLFDLELIDDDFDTSTLKEAIEIIQKELNTI